MSKKPKDKRVLQDHKQIGKKFIPPLLQLRDIVTIKWQLPILPELLWLALLNSAYGTRIGAELAVALASSASKLIPKNLFAPASTYNSLSAEQKTGVVEQLQQTAKLEAIQKGLNSLLWFYPACPLAFLFPTGPVAPEDPKAALEDFKFCLSGLYNKFDRAPMMMQANAIYIAFVTGKMRVAPHLPLANFPEIEKYPTTPESERVGSGVRAATMALFGQGYDKDSTWPQYFWNRGLEVESCDYALIDHQSTVE